MNTMQRKVIETVGPLSYRERCAMFGRMSKIRAQAKALGAGKCLPPLPPIEADLSLKQFAEDAARRAERLQRSLRQEKRRK